MGFNKTDLSVEMSDILGCFIAFHKLKPFEGPTHTSAHVGEKLISLPDAVYMWLLHVMILYVFFWLHDLHKCQVSVWD